MSGQVGIWNAQELNPEDPAYNIGHYIEIHGALDADLFAMALRRTMAEVDAIHFRFSDDAGTPVQRIGDSRDFSFHFIDLTSIADPPAEAEKWMRSDMCCPVDLHDGPVLVTALLKVAPDRFFWYQRAHHIALDGLSGVAIASRQAQIYTSLLTGRSEGAALESLAVLMDADSAYLASTDLDRDREFWSVKLRDLAPAESLSGRPVSRIPRVPVRYTRDIGPYAAANLRVAARRLGTTPAGLAIAAGALFLHGQTGAPQTVVLGVPVPGRTEGRERAIPGMTSNILPVRLTPRREMSVAELLRQVSGEVRAALRHQRYRYEDMLRTRNLVDGRPLVGLIVNVMSFGYALRFGDCSCSVRNLANGPVDDIAVAIYDQSSDGSMQLAVDAHPDLYDAESGTDIARRFHHVLDWVATASRDDRLAQLQLLDEGERRLVLAEWNDTSWEIPAATLPELFAAQVRRVPAAVAVTDGDTATTYAELDASATRLARLLAARGAGPETVVAVLMERSVGLVTALLAVLKTGAAYLPIHENTPPERVAWTLADAGAGVLLTDRAPDGDHAAGVRVLTLPGT